MSITEHSVIHQRDFVTFKGSISSSERIMYSHYVGPVGAKAPFWYLLTEQPGDGVVCAGEQNREFGHRLLFMGEPTRAPSA